MITLPNPRPHQWRESHTFELPICCPVSKNPRPGSTLTISYAPGEHILEVAAFYAHIHQYVGGLRGHDGILLVRDMEFMMAIRQSTWNQTRTSRLSDKFHVLCRIAFMIYSLAKECYAALGVKVGVTAYLLLLPKQEMRLDIVYPPEEVHMPVFCEVCNAPCRGTCSKCGARLCVRHKQPNKRARCLVCSGRPSQPAPQGQQTRMAAFKPALTKSGTPYYVPPAQQSIYTPPPKSLDDMTQEDAFHHFNDLRARLLKKMRRERDYLDRRAARGTHTPTDDAYEGDQILEAELVALLVHLMDKVGH